MADHLQEEEQLEAISQWWQEKRTSVIAAVVLTLGGTIGWSQYEDYTSDKAVVAANAYDELLQEKESGVAAEELALISAGLRDTHSGEVFAEFASLQVAAAAVQAGDLVLARGELPTPCRPSGIPLSTCASRRICAYAPMPFPRWPACGIA